MEKTDKLLNMAVVPDNSRARVRFNGGSTELQSAWLFDPEDMPNVVKVQSGYKVQPLSAFLKQPAPPAAPAIDFPKIDKELVKTGFFDYLDFCLQFAPPVRRRKRSGRSSPVWASAPGRRLISRCSLPSRRPPWWKA
jgi:hypothetical protein